MLLGMSVGKTQIRWEMEEFLQFVLWTVAIVQVSPVQCVDYAYGLKIQSVKR